MTVGNSAVESALFAPLWGRPFMPIETESLNAAGVLVGYLRDKQGQMTEQRGPIGSFFNLVVPSRRVEGYAHPYMVTAAHVVMEQPDIEAHQRLRDGTVKTWAVGDWTFPDDHCMDLAIQRIEAAAPNQVTAIPSWQAMEQSAPGTEPKLGTAVHFFGLLSARGAEQMGLDAVPVVRVGNVAQLNRSGVHWDGMTAAKVHLIDVRSRGGFSGSPCFVEFSYPGPHDSRHEIPKTWAETLKAGGTDPGMLGEMITITPWWGMFVAHVEESGIGVVLPTGAILDFLRTEPFVEIEKMADDAAEAKDPRPIVTPQSSVGDYGRDAFLADLKKTTRRLEEPPEKEV